MCRIVQDLKCFCHAGLNEEWMLADLHECLDSALNIATNEIKYKAVVVKEYGVIPEVECIPSQLSQVSWISSSMPRRRCPENAVGTITVRTRREGMQVCEIADTGSRVAPNVLSRIFDPFFTTKAVRGKDRAGVIAPTASCSGTVADGSRCDSEVGKGTTFRVILPVLRPDAGDAVSGDGAAVQTGRVALSETMCHAELVRLYRDQA